MTGTSPKQHHFVPRFYLERFTNLDGRVWTLDKVTDKVFATSPSKLARASGFYEAPALGTESNQTAMEDMCPSCFRCWQLHPRRATSNRLRRVRQHG